MPKGFDWSFGPGTSPAMGAINAAGTTAGASMVGSLAGLPPLWALTGGVAAAGIAGISAAVKEQPGAVAAYRAACWFGGASWGTYALWTYDAAAPLSSGPWSLGALGVLGGLAAAAGAIGTIMRSATRNLTGASVLKAFAAADRNVREEWEERLRRVGRIPNPKIVGGPERWKDGHGFTLDVDLGSGGHTWKKISAEALASDAALDLGCGVEVSKGIKANRAIIRVATSDALADERPFPENLDMESINNSLAIGWFRDGSPAQINLRWTSGVMAGQKGSGKTNTLHAITGSIARCPDALIMMIAIAKKGAAAEPWTRAYREGRADYPIIDWVADTEAKAVAMCDVLDDLIDQRIEKLVARMRAADDDKVPVGYSPADDLFVPEVIVIADEFAQLPVYLQNRIAAIAEKGRGSSIATFGCSQRATSAHIPTSLKKQSSVRIGMRVSDLEELKYLFGWAKLFDIEDLVGEGYGVLGDGENAPRPMRVFRMSPSTIDRIAVECGKTGRRAEIEPGVLSPAAQKVYDSRFDMKVEAEAAAGRSTRSTSASVSEIGRGVQGVADRLRAQAEALKAAKENPNAAEVAALNELWEMPAAEPTRPAAQPDPEPQDEPAAGDAYERALQLLEAAGERGASAEIIAARLRAEGQKTTRQTVTSWFVQEMIKSDGRVVQPGGKGKPYFYRPKS